MKFDEDLYVQIHTIVRETARKKGFDPQLTEDITQEAAIRVLNALNDPGKEEKIRPQEGCFS